MEGKSCDGERPRHRNKLRWKFCGKHSNKDISKRYNSRRNKRSKHTLEDSEINLTYAFWNTEIFFVP